MNTQASRTQENKSQSITNAAPQKQGFGESTFQLQNNRPEAILQRKLQDQADNSPRVSQLRAFQNDANNSPQAKQTAQLQAKADKHFAGKQTSIQRNANPEPGRRENNTGLPDTLKTGIENLSGYSMDDVKVHYNSDKPAQLQAHAYAQGTDIHLSSGQEKHLPHEAWHVVQQKQGRVKPTLQMKGGVNGNDDAGLETEADVMGAKALSVYSEVAQKAEKFPSVKPEPIIQRAVGYEFETGWIVRREISLNQYVPMKKKETIGFSKFDGFKMEADEAGGGEGEIEFIVHPPIEEGQSGFKKLDGIMDGMEMLGSVLETKKEPFTFNDITKNPQDKMFQIHPHKDGLKAGPQVTSGLDLAKIQDLKAINDLHDSKSPLYGLLHEQGDSQAPEELRGSISNLSNTANEISQKTGDISPELNGLLVVMSNYLEIGGDKQKGQNIDNYTRWLLALSYPKIIADRLLARTNFAKLFKLIPKREQTRYKSKPEEFVNLVNGILPDYVSVKDSIIARGVKKDEEDSAQGITIPTLTIENWLLGLIEGIDLIPTQIKDAESLGEMGEKVESVGEEGRLFSEKRDVGIFEFRGAQTQKIPYKRWKPFALEFQQYISTVHRD